jgi:hypothetical protein
MIETAIQFVVFLTIALCSGLLFPAFYAIIGSPQYFPDPEIGHNFPNVQQLGISKNGMIFRRYGEWLCRKQNEFEAKYNKSRRFAMPHGASKGSSIVLKTSYGRVVKMCKSKCEAEYITLLPGETAFLEFVTDKGVPVQAYLTNPISHRSSMPISPYKAFGICSVCTSFWFMLFALLAGHNIGLFPVQIFWLSPIGYAVAAWASQSYEI